MKRFFGKALVVMAVVGTVFFTGCGQKSQEKEAAYEESIITDYDWQASNDDSLIACETDGTFKYYRSAEDLTDSYYAGTYKFYIGTDAVTYITTELSDYAVTEDELEELFANNEDYSEANFVCLILNNESCIIGGENQIESPYETPYFGFCLEEDGVMYLDIANMNTGNYWLYIGK